MKEESGILPLIEMVGHGENVRQEQTIQAILTRFKELAVPHIIDALENCEDDSRCGGYAVILGKIGDESSIPTLQEMLTKETSGEYIRLQSIYALQEMETVSSYKALIAFLEQADEDEKEIIKDACLSKKLISFPILIELLTHDELSEEHYAEIGDTLAQVQAPSYDELFTELEDEELVKKLASILKEHTPEDEEFLPLHEVLDQYI
jgi:HEAT repeat protein